MSIVCYGNSGHSLKSVSASLDAEETFDFLRTIGLVEERLIMNSASDDSHSDLLSQFKFKFSGVDRQLALPLPNKIFVDFSLLPIISPAELVDLEERQFPIDLRYPRTYADSCIIHFPTGYGANKLPVSRSYEADFGGGEIRFTADDSTLTMTRSRHVDRYQIEPEEFEAFALFLDSCRTILDPRLVLQTINGNGTGEPTGK